VNRLDVASSRPPTGSRWLDWITVPPIWLYCRL
jgi:hypothetical protein